MILKVLVGFLIGFILGVAGTGFLVTSGAGNYLIAANPRVQELEAKIREVESQRAFVTRRLEEVAQVTERMATRFEQLQDRFSELERTRGSSAGAVAPPAHEVPAPTRDEAPAPSAATP